MSGLSNAQLAAQVSDLLTRWNAREDQVQDWLGGTATGGPQGDGRYPLSNARGDTNLIPCPAALAATASGPAAVALGHRDGAEAAREEALSEADRSEAQRVLAESAKAASIAARDLTLQYRDRAANAEANAEVHRQYAEAARVGTAADLEATGDHRDAAEYAAAQAENHKINAAASAAAAGNYNPALYATRADGLSQIAGLQAALDARLLTSGFTWAALSGKPSTFTPSAHSHVIADVTGLQAALDGKQAAGSYAAAAHGHIVGDITGLQAALDAKLASSSFTWANLSGKPSTFTPSAHSHVISDVTGLQAALDAKVASGSAGSLSSLTVGAPGGTTGIIYLGQNQTSPAYLYWNGGSYAMPSGPLLVNGSTVWTAATFDPATKANASHSHAMSDITGLNAAIATRDTTIDLKANKASPVFSGDVVIANGTNKVIFHQPNADAFYLAPSDNAGTGWLWSQQLMYDRTNVRWAFSGPLLVQGHAVWTAGNFTPASKLDTSEVSTSGTANTVVRRDASGYVKASYFDCLGGGLYSSTTGATLSQAAAGWFARSGNTSTSMLMLQTSEGTDRGRIYADSANVIGFLNNDANWALQLQKTGPSFLRVNNALRSIWTSDDMAVHSSRDFVNGTLVTTDLSYPAGSGEAFILEIRGNGYGGSLPFDTVIQGYIYNNTLISVSGISNGAYITGMVALGVGGKLCFWWPRLAYWQGFNVKVYFAQAGEAARNRVTSITDVVKPSGTAEVDIAASVYASWTSLNFDPGTKFNTSGGTLTGSISTSNGADRSLTLASSTSYNYQLITAGDHFHIREASDAAKVRLSITYPNGNVGIGLTGATSRLQVSYANPASVPAAGAGGHAFAAGVAGYGCAIGVLTSGTSYIQSTRWDSTALNYPLSLQPNGGDVGIGTATVTAIWGRTVQIGDGSTASSISLLGTGAGTAGDVFLACTGGTEAQLIARGSTALVLGTNDAERIRITSAGNVGVACTNPAAAFVVGGVQTGNGGLEIVPGSGVVIQGYNRTAGAYNSLNFDGSSIGFRPNGTTRLFVDTTGAAITGDLMVGGVRVPTFTSSTGAPTGGVNGDIHVTY